MSKGNLFGELFKVTDRAMKAAKSDPVLTEALASAATPAEKLAAVEAHVARRRQAEAARPTSTPEDVPWCDDDEAPPSCPPATVVRLDPEARGGK